MQVSVRLSDGSCTSTHTYSLSLSLSLSLNGNHYAGRHAQERAWKHQKTEINRKKQEKRKKVQGATHESERDNNKKKIQGATHESERDNNERDKQELRDFREYGHKTPAEQNAAERWYKNMKNNLKKETSASTDKRHPRNTLLQSAGTHWKK